MKLGKKKKIPTSRLAVFVQTRPTGNNFLLKDGLVLMGVSYHCYTVKRNIYMYVQKLKW